MPLDPEQEMRGWTLSAEHQVPRAFLSDTTVARKDLERARSSVSEARELHVAGVKGLRSRGDEQHEMLAERVAWDLVANGTGSARFPRCF